MIHFSFTQNTSARPVRRHITVLGQQITVTQPVLTLATYALLEGPASGTDSDIVVAGVSWSATSNAAWVHTTSSGTGNGLAIFSFDANSGATRSGTLTIGGLTLTVTQAGSGYVAANPVTLPFYLLGGLGGGRDGQRLHHPRKPDRGVEHHDPNV